MTKETKLPEPVQVGLWYETKAGAIVKIEREQGSFFHANNGLYYYDYGLCNTSDKHDLMRCLGADPFKQVDISKTETTTSKMETVAPTQFERIFTAVLGGLVSNPNHKITQIEIITDMAIKYTKEAIKQLKEIEGA